MKDSGQPILSEDCALGRDPKDALSLMINKNGIKEGKARLHEYFVTAYILYEKTTYSEVIREYVIKIYVKKGLLGMIRPTFSRKFFPVMNRSQYLHEESGLDDTNRGFLLESRLSQRW